MLPSLKPQPQTRSPLLAAAPWIILPPLAHTALFYLSLHSMSQIFPPPMYYLIGIPLCYLLISLLAAFLADGYRSGGHVIERGMLIGLIIGGSGIVLAILMYLLLVIGEQILTYATSPSSISLNLWIYVFLGIVPLLINLFGALLAVLGGLLGGSARFMKEKLILESRREGRSPLLSTTPWIILLSLTPIGLLYCQFLSRSIPALFWLWMASLLLSYPLIGLLATLLAGGYRSGGHAVKKGSLIGLAVGAGSAVLATSVGLYLFSQSLDFVLVPSNGPRTLPIGGIAFLLVDIIFLLANLLGIGLAVLGGLLGGFVRFMMRQRED